MAKTPAKKTTKQFHVMLDKDAQWKLRQICEDRQATQSAVVSAALRVYFDTLYNQFAESELNTQQLQQINANLMTLQDMSSQILKNQERYGQMSIDLQGFVGNTDGQGE